MSRPDRALFIQLRRIGDILMCTPAIRAFKKTFPECKLDFLTEIPAALQGNPHLGSVIDLDASKRLNPAYQFNLIRKISKARYNLVVDFLANPRSAYYAFLSGASSRLSYGYGHRKWAYNIIPAKPAEPQYAAIDRLNLLDAIHIKSDGPRLEFYPSADDRMKASLLVPLSDERPLISISPVSRRDYKQWSLEGFASLGERLAEEFGARIVILAGPGEESVANHVAGMMRHASPLVPRIESLGVLGAILEKVSLHIGNDNGPKHVAVACGAPTFAVFGSQDPVSWTYPDNSRHRWIQPSDVRDDCRRAGHRCGRDCISKIPVEAVWDRVRDMMQSLAIHYSAPRQI